MQNKGFVKVIATLLALVCIYYLSFSIISHSYESKAEAYAQGSNAKYSAFLDSVSTEKVWGGYFFGYNVKDCRERELSLGLDLKGGMNVVMEVSVPDVLKALAGSQNEKPEFIQSIKDANEAQKSSSKPYLELFVEALKKNAPNARLADYFANSSTKEKIKRDATDEAVIKALAESIDIAIDNSFNVLRNRIDRFGVIQPNIQRLTGSNRVLIEMPGVKEPERVRKLLQGSANLEFWETSKLTEVINNIVALNTAMRGEVAGQKLKENNNAETEKKVAAEDTAKGGKSDDLLAQLGAGDSASAADAANAKKAEEENPLFAVLQLNVNQQGQPFESPVIGYARAADTAKISEYFRKGHEKGIIPHTLLANWTIKPIGDGEIYALIALHNKTAKGKEPKPVLTGDVVTNAQPDFEQNSVSASVSMTMNAEGARKWANITRDNVGNCVAIVLDGYVYSYPRVNGEIPGGRSSITGDFTPEEAKDLANVLVSGKMPAPAHIVQEDIVGPSLGQEAINNGFISFLVAFFMILIYMVFYYGKTPGLVADTALIANVVLIFGVLASFKAVLTLPGIAGIVLTLGMAVDANVLIYERTREELRNGKDVKTALSDGYSNSYSAIFDSNLTSILTGIILFYFGTGPIKGFATTLIIGLLSSLFTALLISRLIFEHLLKTEKFNDLTFTTNITKNWFQNVNYDFMKNSKKFLTISGICLVVSVISLLTNGLKPSIDFTGGRNYIVRFENPVTTEEIKSLLSNEFDGVSVVTIGSSNQVRISTNYRIEDEGNTVDDEIEAKLYEGLKSKLGDSVTKTQFVHRYVRTNEGVREAGVDDDSTFGIQSSAKVGATMAHDILEHAAWAVAFALIGIFLYLLLRFRDVAFSVGSIASLVHDTLLIFGVFSLCYKFMPFDMSIDQSFVAAILTVIGYSINDTVVIFDRIREYRKSYPNRNQSQVFNEALGSTLSRTFSTSLSSGIVLVIIFAFGGATIRGFIFAMLLGIIFGTYSSIFIASPIARFILGKKAEKSTKEIALDEMKAAQEKAAAEKAAAEAKKNEISNI